jgi:hypothetical protein
MQIVIYHLHFGTIFKILIKQKGVNSSIYYKIYYKIISFTLCKGKIMLANPLDKRGKPNHQIEKNFYIFIYFKIYRTSKEISDDQI